MAHESRRAVSCNDVPTRRAVEAILRRRGFSVVADVASAAEAVAAARIARPDVVVLDLSLTGDLGLRAVGALHEACPGCAVVVVASFDALRPAALAGGAFDFVGAADLRGLERSLLRLVSERPPLGPRPLAGGAGPVQVDDAPGAAVNCAAAGSRTTKAPPS